MPKYLIAPLVHPSAIVQGMWHLEPPQVLYLRRVLQYVKQGTEPEVEDPSRPPPNTVLLPSLVDLVRFRATLTDGVSLDIENAGPYLLCIGLTGVDTGTWKVGHTLNLPFRLKGGVRYWTRWEDHLAATRWLYELLADPGLAKVFHFGVTHDVPLLEEMGFEVRGRLLDTAVLAHAMYTELPLGLQWNAVTYCGATPWKHVLRQGVEEKE